MSRVEILHAPQAVDGVYADLFPDVLPENKAKYEESKARAKELIERGWHVMIKREGGDVIVLKKACGPDCCDKEN